jgi:Tol biopolymer transport system component
LIYTTSADGTTQDVAVGPALDVATEGEFRVSWSPNGQQLAFSLYTEQDRVRHIYVMDADGSNMHPVTSGPAPDRFPAWSPDGTRIAFERAEPLEGRAVYTINVLGSEPPQLITPLQHPARWIDDGTLRYPGTSFDAHQPAWSPDGKEIAVTDGGEYQIFIVKADGSQETVTLTDESTEGCKQCRHDGSDDILKGEQGATFPAWSPNGTIAFDRARVDPTLGVVRSIWERNLETGVETKRLDGDANFDFRHAAYSPDGQWMAASRISRSGLTSEIVAFPKFLGAPVVVTDENGGGLSLFPAWSTGTSAFAGAP